MAGSFNDRNYGVHRSCDKIGASAVCLRFFRVLYRLARLYICAEHISLDRVPDGAFGKGRRRRISALYTALDGGEHPRELKLGALQGNGQHGNGARIARRVQDSDIADMSSADKKRAGCRTVACIALVALFAVLLSCTACALDVSLPQELDEALNTVEENGIASSILNAVGDSFSLVRTAFSSMLGIFLISGIAGAVRTSALGADTDAFDLVVCLACCGVSFSVIHGVVTMCSSSLISCTVLMTSLLGVMGLVYSYTGNLAAGGGSIAVISAFLQVIQTICSHVLFPLTVALFGFAAADGVRCGSTLGAVTALVKKCVVFTLSLCGVLTSFVLATQCAVGKVEQSVTRRGIKAALSSFVPVIGSALSDTFDTMTASLGAVRTSAGVAGAVSIALFVIPPIIYTCSVRMVFFISSIVSEALGLPSQTRFLKGCGDVMAVILALLCFSASVMIIACGLFSRVNTTL